MTVRLRFDHPDGSSAAWGEFGTVENALLAAEACHNRIKNACLVVEHELSDIEATLHGVPSGTIVEYQT